MPTAETPTLASLLASLGGNRTNAVNSASPEAIAAHQASERARLIDDFDRVPRALSSGEGTSSRAYLKTLGFAVRDQGDPIFLGITPPEGWTIRPSHMEFFSEVLDAQGTLRFRVFYKAAHYDRHGHIEPNARFETATHFLDANGDTAERSELASHVRHVVRDARGGYAYRGETMSCSDRRKATPEENRTHLAEFDASRAKAREWLDATYPDWRDPTAHWDDAIEAVA